MVEKLSPHENRLIKQNQMIEEECKETLYKSHKYAQLNVKIVDTTVTSSIGTQKSGYFRDMMK